MSRREFWITKYPNQEQMLAFNRPCHADLKHLIEEETHTVELKEGERVFSREELRKFMFGANANPNPTIEAYIETKLNELFSPEVGG